MKDQLGSLAIAAEIDLSILAALTGVDYLLASSTPWLLCLKVVSSSAESHLGLQQCSGKVANHGSF